MSLILRQNGPRVIERGVAATLTAEVYLADGTTYATPTVGVYTLRDGGEVVLDAVSATTLGPPATYSLLAATTSSRGLSDRASERWELTISGAVHHFTRAVYIVRTAFHPMVTDTDWTDAHSDLADVRDPDQASFQTYREKANAKIERELRKKGRRPELVWDTDALFDAELALGLYYFFRDSKSSIGDGRYADLAAEYKAEFEREFSNVTFRYDEDESGSITSNTQQATTPPLIFSSGPGAGYGYSYR